MPGIVLMVLEVSTGMANGCDEGAAGRDKKMLCFRFLGLEKFFFFLMNEEEVRRNRRI